MSEARWSCARRRLGRVPKCAPGWAARLRRSASGLWPIALRRPPCGRRHLARRRRGAAVVAGHRPPAYRRGVLGLPGASSSVSGRGPARSEHGGGPWLKHCRAQLAVERHCEYWNARDQQKWSALFADEVVFEDPVGAPPKLGLARGTRQLGTLADARPRVASRPGADHRLRQRGGRRDAQRRQPARPVGARGKPGGVAGARGRTRGLRARVLRTGSLGAVGLLPDSTGTPRDGDGAQDPFRHRYDGARLRHLRRVATGR